MKTATFIAALLALVGLASAQICTPTITCSTSLSAASVPTPWYSLSFALDPRPANAVYNWSLSGVNETGCASAAFHRGVVQFSGATHDSATLGPSINLTAPVTQANSVSTPLPTSVLFGTGTSQGNVQAGTAGWSIEVVFKPLQITNYAKIFDFGADGVGVSGGAGGHYDVLFGWSGTSNQLSWTTNGPNGATGNSPDVNPLSNVVMGQWYHVALVYQETAAGLANYLAYVNGALAATQQNVYFPPAVARASANLARSDWNDAFWVGEIDTYNIYKYALTATQAAALAAGAQGGCNVTFATSAPIANATAPAPFFDASFTTDPRPAAGGALAATYGWMSQDADDVTCGLNTHTGLVQLSGQFSAGLPGGPYINLSTATGSNSVGAVIPTVGGASAGTGESAGWSFEITFKTEVAYTYAKIFDIAAPQNTSNSSPCKYDILLGFLGGTTVNGNQGKQPVMQFDVCNGNGVESSFSNWGTTQLGTWYHIIISIQQLPLQPTQAVYTAYINGVRAGVSGVSYYPEAVARGNADLGKSSWNDNYWGGLIDNFRIYNQALTGPQVNTLYVASMGTAGIQHCPPLAASALPTSVSADAIAYSLTFTPDPSPANALYTWMQSDANDTAADRAIHQGIILLGGSTNSTLTGVGPYVNLSAPTGPASVGQVLPLIGTDINGLWSQGSVGFTLEVVVKMRQQNDWAKVYDLGAARTGGACNGDLVLGWDGDSTPRVLAFETCSDSGSSSSRLGFPGTTYLSQWLHIVVVVQQNYTNQATATGFLNGVQVGQISIAYPFAEYRRDATLGHSDWNDNYINAYYDLFRVYNIALNPTQVAAQYAATRVPASAPVSSSSAAPSVSSGSSSSAAAARSSSSSSSAAVSASSGSSSSAVVSSSSSSSTTTVAAVSSSSTAATAPVSADSSPSSSTASLDSSSSISAEVPSSSTGTQTPPTTVNGAASTLASVAVVAVCAVASLALML